MDEGSLSLLKTKVSHGDGIALIPSMLAVL